jgi:hypothetical protein
VTTYSRSLSVLGQRIDHATLAFSWFLTLALGLMPLADKVLGRDTSLLTPGSAVTGVAVLSALVVRRRHPWIRLVLHIYGQIMIWLSLSCVAIAATLFWARIS